MDHVYFTSRQVGQGQTIEPNLGAAGARAAVCCARFFDGLGICCLFLGRFVR